eukprot:SAG11_NODE_3_length_39220_cov_67.005828_33_plen_57_part_00
MCLDPTQIHGTFVTGYIGNRQEAPPFMLRTHQQVTSSQVKFSAAQQVPHPFEAPKA